MTATGSGYLRKRYRRATRVVAAVTIACLVLAAWFAREWAGDRAYGDLRATAEENLALQVEALTGVMEKYRLIPPLLSRRVDVRALFDAALGAVTAERCVPPHLPKPPQGRTVVVGAGSSTWPPAERATMTPASACSDSSSSPTDW